MTTRAPDVRPSPSPSLPTDPLAGTAYRTLRSAGRGAMGEVVEAQHLVFGRVIVKVLHADLAGQDALADRARLEASVLAKLDSEHIVRFVEFDVTPEGRPFLAMERLVGSSLREDMNSRKRRPYPVREAVDLACQMLEGLACAHRAGVVHRDIKPGNLFVCRTPGADPLLKILDFGVAKLLASSRGIAPLCVPTVQGALIGTPLYLAPEQIKRRPVDARADLYAVGLVLYELLTGRRPFDGLASVAERIRAQVALVPPPPSSHGVALPPGLDAVVMTALEKQPRHRFASAEDFAAHLRRILTPPPPHRVVPGRVEPRSPHGAAAPDPGDLDPTLVYSAPTTIRLPTLCPAARQEEGDGGHPAALPPPLPSGKGGRGVRSAGTVEPITVRLPSVGPHAREPHTARSRAERAGSVEIALTLFLLLLTLALVGWLCVSGPGTGW